ncbi:hypothetical protein [Cryobacterium psychrophilum]|uniref:Uncharacterized protein n=1 Tax=Cryobacterium psychrophilum TaxID=41988 RepID=A0A4Y8KT69_9MICO|nr:hypothetical protein [Cryobacterium psychrophilum]TDW30936.1 hypothetical protein EDD25_2721 [Cryobacterium psychrophilum]TFD80807.1 hypothetical protein E3T53_04020 [Cryobacterium psychrophilum]
MSDAGENSHGGRAENGKAILPTNDTAHAHEAGEARIRFLRSRAEIAQADMDALNAQHLDPDTLEDLILEASPTKADLIRKAEHALSLRVAEARATAEAAEAAYEEAMFSDFDN